MYHCEGCDKPGKLYSDLLIHHKDNSRKTGKLNDSPDNLEILCRRCNAERHGFTKDHQKAIKLRESGLTFQEIGNILGISRQRAFQLAKIG